MTLQLAMKLANTFKEDKYFFAALQCMLLQSEKTENPKVLALAEMMMQKGLGLFLLCSDAKTK